MRHPANGTASGINHHEITEAQKINDDKKNFSQVVARVLVVGFSDDVAVGKKSAQWFGSGRNPLQP